MAKTAKEFGSVAELVDDLSASKEEAREVKKYIADREMSRILSCMRMQHKLSQKEMASLSDLSQGMISKIERKENDEIRLKDLRIYAKAMNYDVRISFHKPVSIAQRIQIHTNNLMHCFEELKGLSKNDHKMLSGVIDLARTVLDKVEKIIGEIDSKLPKKKSKKEYGHIEIESECEDRTLTSCP